MEKVMESGNGYAIVGMSSEDYHAHPAISNSGLSLMLKSPAHFKYRHEIEQTASMAMGEAIHKAILEPDHFESDYVRVEAKDRRSKEWNDAVAEHGDKCMLASDFDKIIRMVESTYQNEEAFNLLDGIGFNEISVFSKDPWTGIEVKCRFDRLTSEGIAIDVKKTRDSHPFSFRKSILDYSYHMQSAFYSSVYEWAFDKPIKEFLFLAIEDKSPYPTRIFKLDENSMKAGEIQFRKALDLYAWCLQEDKWPLPDGYCTEISIPEYGLNLGDKE